MDKQKAILQAVIQTGILPEKLEKRISGIELNGVDKSNLVKEYEIQFKKKTEQSIQETKLEKILQEIEQVKKELAPEEQLSEKDQKIYNQFSIEYENKDYATAKTTAMQSMKTNPDVSCLMLMILEDKYLLSKLSKQVVDEDYLLASAAAIKSGSRAAISFVARKILQQYQTAKKRASAAKKELVPINSAERIVEIDPLLYQTYALSIESNDEACLNSARRELIEEGMLIALSVFDQYKDKKGAIMLHSKIPPELDMLALYCLIISEDKESAGSYAEKIYEKNKYGSLLAAIYSGRKYLATKIKKELTEEGSDTGLILETAAQLNPGIAWLALRETKNTYAIMALNESIKKTGIANMFFYVKRRNYEPEAEILRKMLVKEYDKEEVFCIFQETKDAKGMLLLAQEEEYRSDYIFRLTCLTNVKSYATDAQTKNKATSELFSLGTTLERERNLSLACIAYITAESQTALERIAFKTANVEDKIFLMNILENKHVKERLTQKIRNRLTRQTPKKYLSIVNQVLDKIIS